MQLFIHFQILKGCELSLTDQSVAILNDEGVNERTLDFKEFEFCIADTGLSESILNFSV